MMMLYRVILLFNCEAVSTSSSFTAHPYKVFSEEASDSPRTAITVNL